MFDYKQLRVWQRSHLLAAALYRELEDRSSIGAPGLAAQLQRAAASIAANIAEGSAQDTSRQCARFLTIAIASASETENHLAFAASTGLFAPEVAQRFTQEVIELRRMLMGLRRWVLAQSR